MNQSLPTLPNIRRVDFSGIRRPLGDPVPTPIFISSVSAAGPSDGMTTPIDTRGASLIVIAMMDWESSMEAYVADSLGNSYSTLTPAYGGLGTFRCRMLYCAAPMVSDSHSFQFSSGGGSLYGAMIVAAFGGIGTAGVEFESVGADSGSTCQPGNITPSGASVVCTAVGNINGSLEISDGFSIINQLPFNDGVNWGAGLAYKFQGAEPANPTWQQGGSGAIATTIANFI